MSAGRWCTATALALSVAACSGGEPTAPAGDGPSTPAVARLRILDGDGQRQVVGKPLDSPLRVVAETPAGGPVANTVVTWTLSAGEGLASPASGRTDSLGIASTQWSLGPTAGPVGATASVAGGPSVSFTATAVHTYCEKYGGVPGVRVTCEAAEYSWLTHDQEWEPWVTATRVMDVFAPATGSGPFPIVLAIPGGCQDKQDVEWIAPLLAARGYVVAAITVATTVGGNGARADCIKAVEAATDVLASAANPYLDVSDPTRLGGVGWSLGARVLVAVQELDTRYAAIVAWDNLGPNEYSDAEAPFYPARVPRAPAMGQASDRPCEQTGGPCGPDGKKAGYEVWRAAGTPSMQLVFEGSDHGAFAEGGIGLKPFIGYYTLAWLDRWLRGDASATARLLADPVAPADVTPRARSALLSATFGSAAFLDGHDCPDLRSGCS